MKRLIPAALIAAAITACGAHTTPATVTVTTTPPPVTITAPEQPTMPPPPMVKTPDVVRQWVNAGQLDFYVDTVFYFEHEYPTAAQVGVQMYVRNSSGVPQTYSADAQVLTDDQGRVFTIEWPTAGDTTTSEPPGGWLTHFDLNAGLTSGLVYVRFKVPQGMTLSQFTLLVHGSHTSIGNPIHFRGTVVDHG